MTIRDPLLVTLAATLVVMSVLWLVSRFISLPIQLGMRAQLPATLTWLDLTGVLLWGVGLFFEAVGDWQMARFKADPDNAGVSLLEETMEKRPEYRDYIERTSAFVPMPPKE